jgi:hypothetical protein
MSDPRNPKRPGGSEGDSWAQCRRCRRGAPKARLIRHSKACVAWTSYADSLSSASVSPP